MRNLNIQKFNLNVPRDYEKNQNKIFENLYPENLEKLNIKSHKKKKKYNICYEQENFEYDGINKITWNEINDLQTFDLYIPGTDKMNKYNKFINKKKNNIFINKNDFLIPGIKSNRSWNDSVYSQESDFFIKSEYNTNRLQNLNMQKFNIKILPQKATNIPQNVISNITRNVIYHKKNFETNNSNNEEIIKNESDEYSNRSNKNKNEYNKIKNIQQLNQRDIRFEISKKNKDNKLTSSDSDYDPLKNIIPHKKNQ